MRCLWRSPVRSLLRLLDTAAYPEAFLPPDGRPERVHTTMNRSARLRQKFLDGRYRWGVATRSTGRYGSESISLLIHPPEASTVDRRSLRLARLWPGVGTGLFLLVGFAGSAVAPISTLPAFGAAAVFVLGVGAALSRITTPIRARMVSVFATVSVLSPRDADQRRFEHASTLAQLLDEAEQALDAGEIAWDTYLATWTSVYWDARTTTRE